jgi:hypothetical protein
LENHDCCYSPHAGYDYPSVFSAAVQKVRALYDASHRSWHEKELGSNRAMRYPIIADFWQNLVKVSLVFSKRTERARSKIHEFWL